MAGETTLNNVKTDELIDALQGRGYFASKVPPPVEARTFKPDMGRFTGKAFRFGVLSCTHLGSKYSQMSALHAFYRLAKKRGCEFMLHTGDNFDGSYNMHLGILHEQFAIGADAQLEYAVKNYPKDVPTFMISGNHCLSFYKDNGFNIVKAFADKRDDITYLGDMFAKIELWGLKIVMAHGSGGVPYARSYRLQKMVEAMASENKPNFLFVGHWHVPAYIPQLRNVEAWSMGCFQSQTPYLVGKQLYPVIGGLIVEVRPDGVGIGTVKYEWVPTYVPIENDY